MMLALTIVGAWLAVGSTLCFIAGAAIARSEAMGRRSVPQQLHATIHLIDASTQLELPDYAAA